MRMRNAKKIGADLRRFMRRRELTELELAQRVSAKNKQISLTQSWVSRIAHGRFKRPTERVRSIAEYANIPVFERSQLSTAGAKIIHEAVQQSWNGSIFHATIIARLIRAARDIDGPGQPK
jgi:transcriptional regulator with XRE-family HTH domain